MQELENPAAFSPEFSLSRLAPAAEAGRSSSDGCRSARLARIVETELIPRLMLAYARAPARLSLARPVARLADPDRLVEWLLQGRRDEAQAFVDARLQGGACARSVMIEDLGPAARKLGALWENDECDFVEVTLGLRALQDIMRGLMPEDFWRPGGTTPSILILLAPGESHELGADMVESFFRTSGWNAERAGESTFEAALSDSWFDAVGFSVSCDRFLDPLRKAIRQARAASRNPALRVLVGGAIFDGKPHLAGDLGADFCAADADAAVHLSRTLLQGAKL